MGNNNATPSGFGALVQLVRVVMDSVDTVKLEEVWSTLSYSWFIIIEY